MKPDEGILDEWKGRIREAFGVLTGNSDMRRKGRADQWTGQAKEAASEAIDEVRESVESVVDRVSDEPRDDTLARERE